MPTETKRCTVSAPIDVVAYGIRFTDKDGDPITDISIDQGWLPASGDKLTVTYKPKD